jgi:hypothetical protein
MTMKESRSDCTSRGAVKTEPGFNRESWKEGRKRRVRNHMEQFCLSRVLVLKNFPSGNGSQRLERCNRSGKVWDSLPVRG